MKRSLGNVAGTVAIAALVVAPGALAQFGLQGTAVNKMTKDDWSFATETIRKALDDGRDGQSYSWTNPKTGASGSVVPSAAFVRDGSKCRKASFAFVAGGSKGESSWTLCKLPDGWKAID